MTIKFDSEFCNVDYDETIKLCVESSELSMKAACAVATLPVKMYVNALTCWANAVSGTLDCYRPDPCEDESDTRQEAS